MSPSPRREDPPALLRREDRSGVATLTLKSPASRNALSLAMIEALIDAFAAIEADAATRVVVLAGDGPALSAGHDLKELQAHRNDADRGRAFFERAMTRCAELMRGIVALEKPVIAAVEGVATAAGCQLVAACDLAIAGADARFALPGVSIGLFCSTPLVAVGRAVSRKHAMEMALTGDLYDARDGRALRPRQSRRPGRRGARRSARARSAHRRPFGGDAGDRQARVLSPDRHAARRSLRARRAGDGRKPPSSRFRRRRRRLSRQAAATLGGRVNHDSYSDDYIRDILATVKTIAMVGASANTARPSYFVLKYLSERGFTMLPINPGLAGETILGLPVYASLADVPQPIDMVDVFRRSEAAGEVVDAALALATPPKVIWMQLGVRDDAAAARAEARGVKVVMNRCPKIEYGRLSGEIGWSGVNSRILSAKKPIAGPGFQRLTIDKR